MKGINRKRFIAILTALLMALSIEGSWAVSSYGAAQPKNPAAPAKFAAETDPAQPPHEEEPEHPDQNQPTDPEQPTDPAEPTDPSEPTEPEQSREIEQVQPKLKTASIELTSVKLSWNKVKDAEGYEIFSADTKKGTYKKLASREETSYTHKKLTTGKTYYYKVRAFQTIDGEKFYSKDSAPVKAVPRPAAPTISLTAGEGKITVKWKKISGVSGYELYRASSAKGKFKQAARVKKSGTVKYVNEKLGKAKTYYFKVRAYKTVAGKRVYGPFSAVKKKKTIDGLDRRVTAVYNAATKNVKGKSKIKRLRACYDYMINGHFGYTRRGMVARGVKGWQARYAEQFLKDKTGNCFGWAATFYYLAKKCGYEPRNYSGSCHYRNGNTGRHGWTEITMNGRSYIFDPEMHWSYIHRVGSYYNGWKRVPGTTAMRYIK